MSINSKSNKKIAVPNKKTNTTHVKHSYKMYKIVWRDAFSEVDEWLNEDSLESEEYICETIGYLIETNVKPNYYTIASTITIDGYFCCVINIPKDMVISKKRITII